MVFPPDPYPVPSDRGTDYQGEGNHAAEKPAWPERQENLIKTVTVPEKPSATSLHLLM
jgi:hypothetical protein